MTILNPKEVSALLKDLEPDSPQSGAGKSDFGTADFQKNQKPQKAALLKTKQANIPTKLFIPPQFITKKHASSKETSSTILSLGIATFILPYFM